MLKQMLILHGTLFLMTITSSAGLPSVNEDELVFKFQHKIIVGSTSNSSFKIDGIEDINSLIHKLLNSTDRENSSIRHQISTYNITALTDHENSTIRHETPTHNTTDSNDTRKQFGEEMLKSHNNYRKRHCASALEFDEQLSRSAQAYAEKLARTNTFKYSKTPGLGENLWLSVSSEEQGNINGSQSTDDWYNEIKDYDFDKPGFSMKIGHFTQLVWKGTKKVGTGIAYSDHRKKAYVVAHYTPPGNYVDQFKENVLQATC